MLTTHESDAAARRYLVEKNALWKLATPVSLLVTGNPRHAEALRRKRREARSRRSFAAWSIPFPLLGSLIRF